MHSVLVNHSINDCQYSVEHVAHGLETFVSDTNSAVVFVEQSKVEGATLSHLKNLCDPSALDH